MNQSNDELEARYDDLDLPQVDICSILLTLEDTLEIDPLLVLNGIQQGLELTPQAEVGMRVMHDLIYLAIESSSQISHIIEGVDLLREMD